MKKIILGLGAIASIAAPVAAVVSCGNKTTKKGFDFSNDIKKIKDGVSTKNKTDLEASVGSKEVGAAVTLAELGVAEITFSEGVTATYTVKTKYNTTTTLIAVEAVLMHGEDKSVATKFDITAKVEETYAQQIFAEADTEMTQFYKSDNFEETETYPRSAFVFGNGTDVLAKVLAVTDTATSKPFTIETVVPELDKIGSAITNFIMNDLQGAEFASFIQVEKDLQKKTEPQSQISLGTFISPDSTTDKDDMIILAINGLSLANVLTLVNELKGIDPDKTGFLFNNDLMIAILNSINNG